MAAIDVSRYANRKTLNLKVKVLTPMFLGGADGNAELRAAPFRAAIRYWWRVVVGVGNSSTLLKNESELFGGVKIESVKSKVDVSVAGNVKVETPVFSLNKINHPEAEKAHCKVDGPGYLAGMGHYNFKKGFTKKAILPEQEFNLKVAYPHNNKNEIEKTLTLMNVFGTIGARSRNGFGSFIFTGFNNIKIKNFQIKDYSKIINDKENAYPHSLTGDSTGLTFWKLKDNNQTNNGAILRELADVYIKLKTSPFFKFKTKGPGERHLLGYPVMNHGLNEWGGNSGRVPSQLRLMVKNDTTGNLNGYILHIAHALPQDKKWFPQLASQQNIWQEVHKFLDNKMERVKIQQEVDYE